MRFERLRGRVVQRFQDLNGDGQADRIWHASDWDANRRVTAWAVVSNQGHILFEEMLWYFPNGELERKERRDVNGELIQQVVRNFNDLGQVLEELYDYNGNGYADLIGISNTTRLELIGETKDYTHNPGPEGNQRSESVICHGIPRESLLPESLTKATMAGLTKMFLNGMPW